MRKHGRTDQNQRDVIEAFRRLGAAVVSIAAIGGGVPDLLVALDGVTYLIEVKLPGGKLKASQEAFRASWPAPVFVVRGVDDVVALVSRLRGTR